ncbi:serine hydrolase [Brucella sp. BE17]|uniref:serine hydrolase domain-containing protein n=1 Tax=Brucella sp. BE17 TaxID=3142977 RepID=UPI0031BADBE3
MTDPFPAFSRRDLLRSGATIVLACPFFGALARPVGAQDTGFADLLDIAAGLTPLKTMIIARDGEILVERGFRGHATSAPTNIKSASKSVMATLIGIAIDRGILKGVEQRIAPLLRNDVPADADPRIEDITVGDLLSMQSGLRPTSGPVYGQWVASRNWVRGALAQPFEDDPGGRMLYSTGSTHLLSAILTGVTGRSSLANARDWLGGIEGFSIAGWERDPQGIYLGGNEMAMSSRSLLAFGELWRRGGLDQNGARHLSASWVEHAWTTRTTSRWSGDGYGYGWFLRNMAGEEMRYAWGYGGQMLYIVRRLGLSVVMTSDDTPRPTTIADRDSLHALAAQIIERVRQG